MAKLSTKFAAALTISLAVLAASHTQLMQQDIMRDYSGLPPWFAFTFGFKVQVTYPVSLAVRMDNQTALVDCKPCRRSGCWSDFQTGQFRRR